MTDYQVTGLQPARARTKLGVLAGDGAGWARIDGGPVPAYVRLGKSENGRLTCTALAFDGDSTTEITARMLRAMPLGELVSAAAGRNARGRGGELMRWMASEGAPGGVARTRPGPQGYPPEHYEMVAKSYRRALELAPRSPVKWLAEQLHASEPTVRRWVQKSRDLGHMGPSMPGRAGEATKETDR